MMGEIAVGYCRCSTDLQDLTAQREALHRLGVTPERIYIDRIERLNDRDNPHYAQRQPVPAHALRPR
jgi:hypothetical protein